MLIIQHFNIGNTDVPLTNNVLDVVVKYLNKNFAFPVNYDYVSNDLLITKELSKNDIAVIENTLDAMYPVLVNLSNYQKPIDVRIDVIKAFGNINQYIMQMGIPLNDNQNITS